MSSRPRRTLLRRAAGRAWRTLPPVRRRDELIASLRTKITASDHELTTARAQLRSARGDAAAVQGDLEVVRAELDVVRRELEATRKDAEAGQVALERLLKESRPSVPSFRRYVALDRRLADLGIRLESKTPRLAVLQKLYAQDIARACGVATPQVFATWATAEGISLGELPNEFVLKSAGGASSRGVLPLRRTTGGYELISHDTRLTEDDVREHFLDQTGSRRLRAPFFAEELLRGTTGDIIPLDIKVYAFYGEVGHVLLRRVVRHGDPESVTARYLDADGADLGPLTPDRTIDASIPIPARLPDALDAARRLSVAVRLPFVRVDLYETERGTVFGELTPRPGGPQRYRREHDRLLGAMWEEAQARLERDLAAGAPYLFQTGDVP